MTNAEYYVPAMNFSRQQHGKFGLCAFFRRKFLLLSGCSAVLNAIYTNRQIINGTVQVLEATHQDYNSGFSYVGVELTDRFGRVLPTLGPLSYDFQFTKLQSATYGLYSYYHSSGGASNAVPVGSYSYFTSPSGYLTCSIFVPYAASSDITSLTVVIP